MTLDVRRLRTAARSPIRTLRRRWHRASGRIRRDRTDSNRDEATLDAPGTGVASIEVANERISALLRTGPPIVVVPAIGDAATVDRTVRRLLRVGTAPEQVRVVGPGADRTRAFLVGAGSMEQVPVSAGRWVRDVEAVLGQTTSDLVLVEPGAHLAAGWLRALRHASYTKQDTGMVVEPGASRSVAYLRKEALQAAGLPLLRDPTVSTFLDVLADSMAYHGWKRSGTASGWDVFSPDGSRDESDGVDRTFSRPPKPQRILYALHAGDGGTPASARDLASNLGSQADAFVLTSDTELLRLWHVDEHGASEQVEVVELHKPLRFLQPTQPEYRAILERIIVDHGIDVVHVRHVYRHTLDLPAVARALGCRVVLSIHDSYLICPTIHLLDDHGRFCGGVCTPGEGVCKVGPEWLRPVAATLKHGYIHRWRELVSEMLEHVDVAVTTSTSMRNLITAAYPQLKDRIDIVEHGRDLPPPNSTARRRFGQPVDRPLRVLIPGFLAYHKGGDVLRAIRSLDVEGDIEFHLLGHVERAYRDLGVVHGRYGREEFHDRVSAIQPDVAAILSVCAESYCHTLTECWSVGLPVVGTRLGAVGERIDRHGGGWVVDVEDPALILDLLRRLREHPDAIATTAREITPDRFVPATEMAARYLDLYRGRAKTSKLIAVIGEDEQPSSVRLDRSSTAGSEVPMVRTVPVPTGLASVVSHRLEHYSAVALVDPERLTSAERSMLAVACAEGDLPLFIPESWHGELASPDQRPALQTDAFDATTLVDKLRASAPSDPTSEHDPNRAHQDVQIEDR